MAQSPEEFFASPAPAKTIQDAGIFRVACARGVAIVDDAVALALIDGSPEQVTASMQRDCIAGRPSELEAQVGVVVRAVKDMHLNTAPRGWPASLRSTVSFIAHSNDGVWTCASYIRSS